MSKARRVVFGLIGVSLAFVAGCPTVDPNPPVTVTIDGTWSGTLSCTSTESLSGTPATPRTSTRDFTITFDADGVPTSLPVWGFSGAPDQTATISAVGESQTFNFTDDGRATTVVVTITQATYTGSSAQIVMSLQYTASEGALQQTGTGTVTISATDNGTTLTFSADADYDVTQTAGDITLETGETIECDGTLTEQ